MCVCVCVRLYQCVRAYIKSSNSGFNISPWIGRLRSRAPSHGSVESGTYVSQKVKEKVDQPINSMCLQNTHRLMVNQLTQSRALMRVGDTKGSYPWSKEKQGCFKDTL